MRSSISGSRSKRRPQYIRFASDTIYRLTKKLHDLKNQHSAAITEKNLMLANHMKVSFELLTTIKKLSQAIEAVTDDLRWWTIRQKVHGDAYTTIR